MIGGANNPCFIRFKGPMFPAPCTPTDPQRDGAPTAEVTPPSDNDITVYEDRKLYYPSESLYDAVWEAKDTATENAAWAAIDRYWDAFDAKLNQLVGVHDDQGRSDGVEWFWVCDPDDVPSDA